MRLTIPPVLLLAIARPAQAQTGCRLVGVWELVSGQIGGQPCEAGKKVHDLSIAEVYRRVE